MSNSPNLAELAPTLRRASVCHDQCLFASWAVRTSRRQTLAPSRRAWLAQLVNDGVLSWEGTGMVAAFFAGDTTGLQREHCPCELDEAQMLWSARSDIVKAGKAPTAVADLDQRLIQTGTPFEEATSPEPDTYAPTTFFLDAPTRFLHPGFGDQVRSLISAFSPGAGLVTSGSSGFEAYDVGLVETADACVQALVTRLVAHGVTRLIVESPGALFMLRRLSPAGLEVSHTSQFLDETIGQLPDRGLEPIRVTVQDSSLLARYCDLIEAPRRVLRRLPGVEVIEMPTHGTLANPTGGRLWPPDQSALVPTARSRIAEAETTSASIIITLGPYTRRNLIDAADPRDTQVMDLVEFLLERVKK